MQPWCLCVCVCVCACCLCRHVCTGFTHIALSHWRHRASTRWREPLQQYESICFRHYLTIYITLNCSFCGFQKKKKTPTCVKKTAPIGACCYPPPLSPLSSSEGWWFFPALSLCYFWAPINFRWQFVFPPQSLYSFTSSTFLSHYYFQSLLAKVIQLLYAYVEIELFKCT